MDQGINYGFNSQGIDPATFGLPNWADGWHKVVLIGSAAKPLSDPSKGGRMQFKIKCIEGPEAGKEHFIGLNLYHNDPETRKRAEQEMASICHVTGKHAFQNTAELYNIPFFVLAETQTSAPTPQYPNPKPQTNFRGYRDVNGNEPGKQGGATGGQPAGGPPANFGAAPQGQPAGFAPQGGAPGFAPGGAPNPGAPAQFQPAGQPQQFQPGQPAAAPGFAPQAAPGFAPQGQPGQFQQPGATPGFAPAGAPGAAPGFAPQQGQPNQPGAAPQWGPQGGAPGAAPGGWPGQ